MHLSRPLTRRERKALGLRLAGIARPASQGQVLLDDRVPAVQQPHLVIGRQVVDVDNHVPAVQPLTRGVVRAQSALLNMLGYMYILRCRDQKYYFGSTNDLIRRLADHRAGRVRSTKPRLPIELVYFEKCKTLDQARQRERSFKNGRTRRKTIDLLIGGFPPDRLAPFV